MHDQADFEVSITLLDESLALYRDLGDKRGIANVLINTGHLAWYQGDFLRRQR